MCMVSKRKSGITKMERNTEKISRSKIVCYEDSGVNLGLYIPN